MCAHAIGFNFSVVTCTEPSILVGCSCHALRGHSCPIWGRAPFNKTYAVMGRARCAKAGCDMHRAIECYRNSTCRKPSMYLFDVLSCPERADVPYQRTRRRHLALSRPASSPR